MTRKTRGLNTPAHPEHGSYVMGCEKWKGRGRVPCGIDWDDPDEYDELSNESEQCVTFWCSTCEQWKLCVTWHRSGPNKR